MQFLSSLLRKKFRNYQNPKVLKVVEKSSLEKKHREQTLQRLSLLLEKSSSKPSYSTFVLNRNEREYLSSLLSFPKDEEIFRMLVKILFRLPPNETNLVINHALNKVASFPHVDSWENELKRLRDISATSSLKETYYYILKH